MCKFTFFVVARGTNEILNTIYLINIIANHRNLIKKIFCSVSDLRNKIYCFVKSNFFLKNC
jgi:hypothetical protein